MANVGEATNPPPAPGEAQYNAMRAASDDATAQAWKQDQQQKLMKGGYSPAEADAYFGDQPSTSDAIRGMVERNLTTNPPPGGVNADPLHALASGFNMSVTGLAIHGAAAKDAPDPHPTFVNSLLRDAGQMAGDLPASLTGFFAGTAAGAVAGAAIPVAGETGAGEAGGMLVGGGFGFGAAPVAAREAMLDAYNRGEIKTPADFLRVVGASTLKTIKAGVVGAASQLVGGAVGGKLAAAGIHAGVAAVGGTVANAATGVAVGSALDGKLPSKEDFVTAGASALILHGLGAGGEVIKGRFTPDATAAKVQNNLETLYRQTGMPPWDAVNRSRFDPAIRQEIFGQDVNGEPNLANLRNISPKEPEPYAKPAEAAQEAPATPGSAVTPANPVDRFLGLSTRLEGSRDDSVSPVGAVGRHQIMPGTARQYMGSNYDVSQLFNPAENLRVATRIAQDLTGRYPGDEAAQMVAYNAGPGRANQLVTKGPGTRLEAVPDKTLRGGIRYESVAAPRDESFLPLETQKYLANARRIAQGQLTEGSSTPPPPSKPEAPEASSEVATTGGGGGGKPPAEPPTEPPADAEPAERVNWWKNAGEENLTDEMLRKVGEQPDPKGTPLSTQVARYYSELAPARDIDTRLIKDSSGTLDRNRDFMVEDGFRQTYGSDTRAGVFSRAGVIDAITMDIKKNSPSDTYAMKALKEGGGSVDGLRAYMMAAHTLDLEKRGINSGMNVDAATALHGLPSAKRKYNDAFQIMDKVNDGVLAYGRDSGLYSDDQIARMKAASPLGYAPFKRIMGENDPHFGSGTSSKFAVRDPLKRAEGSDRDIVDPIQSTLENRRMVIRMADRNRAIGQVVSLAEGAPQLAENLGLQRLKFDPKETISADANDSFKAYGMEPEEGAKAFQFALAEKASRGFNPNEFIYYRKGIAEKWSTTDPQLAELMRRTSSPQEADLAVKMMQGFASLQRAGIVIDPTFVPKVVLRHQLTAYSYDPLHPPPYVNTIKGIFHVVGKSDLFYDTMAKGGLGTSLVEMDTDRIQKDIEETFDKTGVFKSVSNAFLHPIQFSQAIHEGLDAAQRVGYRIHADSQGVEPLKAATMGRKAYLDYSERASSEMANRIAKNVPFFRPNMLGQKQAFEAFETGDVKKSAVIFKTLTALSIGILAPNIGLYVANYFADKSLPDGQKYQDLPRWVRDAYFVTPPINGARLRMKYPPIMGMPLGGMVNRTLDAMLAHDPHAFDDWAVSFAKEFMPPMMPSFAQAPIENVTNHSFNSGRTLIPATVDKASGYMQYTENTTQPAKEIAKLLGPTRWNVPGLNQTSPIQIENLVNGWTGTMGMGILHALDKPFKPIEPDQIANNPFVGSFFIRNPGTGAQPILDFYKDMDDLSRTNADFHMALKQQDEGNMNDSLAQGGLVGVKALAKLKSAVSMIVSTIHSANEDKTMTVDEKRQIIDQALPQAIELSHEGTRIAKEIETSMKHGTP